MAHLPPEIIDAIICKVEDPATLKSCSLVSSALFRYPSQRRLFRFLTLNGWATPPNYNAVSTLLDESPHIAAYFTHLRVVLPDEGPSIPDIGSLKHALSKISHVRWCMLDGGRLAFHAPFLRFLARQRSLRELHIDSFSAIPQDVMLEILTAAPGLSFKSTSVDTASSLRCRSPPNWARIFSRPIERLAVEADSSSVVELMNGGQLAKLVGQMRFLSVVSDCEESMRLVQGCAETLEHLRFNGIEATDVHMQQLYDCVRKGMPQGSEKGRLVLEQFEEEDDWWNDCAGEDCRRVTAPEPRSSRISRIKSTPPKEIILKSPEVSSPAKVLFVIVVKLPPEMKDSFVRGKKAPMHWLCWRLLASSLANALGLLGCLCARGWRRRGSRELGAVQPSGERFESLDAHRSAQAVADRLGRRPSI
ncbi:hypothetical protein FB45DRAFT_1007777 [Roridomyces roridus]|uniref:F-box domain-containing protein n=1 Tax=Roridomyces roridus TaxID=1738132 RepID=A0AAD7BCF8_9AGAR|nr:hypothetical protein FB45DRAFT_1007777 [Roridomyces roridus]